MCTRKLSATVDGLNFERIGYELCDVEGYRDDRHG